MENETNYPHVLDFLKEVLGNGKQKTKEKPSKRKDAI